MDSTNRQDLTDSDLLKACVPDDEKAFWVLSQRYEKQIFQYLMKIVNDATLVEETLIEVLQPSRKDSLHFKASPRWQLGSLALPTTRQ